jgi:hypothetical protein
MYENIHEYTYEKIYTKMKYMRKRGIQKKEWWKEEEGLKK